MNYEELKKEVFNKVVEDENRVLKSIENILNSSKYKDDDNYEKLVKQLSYDYLVKKRREYKREDLLDGTYQCENPANFPFDKSPFDKVNHIDCLTAWIEDWEDISSNDIEFKYLKNLDAKFVILGKDSTGKNDHKQCVEKLINIKKYDPTEVEKFINKVTKINPLDNIEGIEVKDIEDMDIFRFGFSRKGVSTNTNLRTFCERYINEDIGKVTNGLIIPKENQNVFLINSFVFLSAENMSPSIVPDNVFKKSLEEFIIPLLDIIKPKSVIQGGTEAIIFSRNAIYKMINKDDNLKNLNTDYETMYKKHKKVNGSLEQLLNCTHAKMTQESEAKEFLYHIQWNEKNVTYFYPVNHPSRPKYFYDYNDKCQEDGHLVWKHINKYTQKNK